MLEIETNCGDYEIIINYPLSKFQKDKILSRNLLLDSWDELKSEFEKTSDDYNYFRNLMPIFYYKIGIKYINDF